jgi:hypothetical protein
VALFLILSLYLPMFGASAILVTFLEHFILRRNEAIRKWLSLGAPSLQKLPPG